MATTRQDQALKNNLVMWPETYTPSHIDLPRGIVNTDIEAYAAQHSTPESELFRDLVRATYEKTAIPQMQVGHLEGTFLRLMTKMVKAKKVLEIGTFTGYSALSFAEGLPDFGKVITCDIDPKTTQIAREHWAKSPHGKKIDLRMGPAAETIKTLKGPFDIVFIDADKGNYIRYWELCVPRVKPGGLLLVDNVLWHGTVLNPQDESALAIVAVNQHILKDPRVELLMLPFRDGVTMAYKRP